jgi:hypothetical protein
VHAYEQSDLAGAESMLAASVAAVSLAGQSFVLLSALEALAAVLSDLDQPRQAALLLGAAQTAFGAATAHMRPMQARDDDLRTSLVQVLGADEFDKAHAEGARLSPTEAVHLAVPATVP